MWIDHEMLKGLGACKEGLKFFDKHFSHGVEMIEFLSLKHIPPDIIWWGYDHIGFDSCPSLADQEYKLYEQALNIVDSKYHYHCYQLQGCEIVGNSHHIKNSNFVWDSSFIENGDNISDSANVKNGCEVYHSKMITNSDQIYVSTAISNSYNIACSSNIFDSSNIYLSNDLKNCSLMRLCSESSDSSFCANSKNLKNCLFCSNIDEGGEFLVFNRQIDKTFYDMIFEQFAQFEYKATYTFPYETNEYKATHIKINGNFSQHYELPSDFIDWVKTIPNYNDEIMYEITCQSQFLR